MADNYWTRVTAGRASRRRFLSAGAVSVGAAALLAACGRGDGQPGSGAGSSLVGKPVDSTVRAKRGGVMVISATADPTDFDGLTNASTTGGRTIWVYSRLLKHAIGKYPGRADGSQEGDAAESWEVSPDATQVTLKLRAGMPFDQRPPTSGRALKAADVKFSWEKFAAKHPARTDIANSVTQDAPIVSFQAPDDRTIVVKLAFPYAPITELLAWPYYVQIEPTEAEGGFDPRSTTRGSSAWSIDKFQPSVSLSYRRNQQWYVKDRPFLDGFDVVVLPEYASGLAQFRTGNVWTYPVKQEDILPTKKGASALNLFQASAFANTVPSILTFGLNPGSPFADERIRQATSMLLDRDQWMTTFFNLDKFKAEGLDVPTAWSSFVPTSETRYYLDPRSKDFGDTGKYFIYNPAEAKKLIQAATGDKQGLATSFTYTTNGYGVDYVQQSEALRGMLEANGDFRLKVDAVDYNSVFRFGFSNAPGNYEGIAPTPTSPKANIDQFVFAAYHSKGSRNKVPGGDPKFDDLVSKQRAEIDANKRTQYIQELQRYAAAKMYSVPFGGLSLGFTLAWPWAGNFQTYNSWVADPVEAYTHYWFDESKKT